MLSYLFLLLAPAVLGLPQPTPDGEPPEVYGPCSNPAVRKEWRQLENEEKTAYLDAVECLMNLPGQGTSYFASIKTRYDDFVSLHTNSTTRPVERVGTNRGLAGPGVHYNGVFLPWHRYAISIFESVLRDECGFEGTHPYWDWSLDSVEHGATLDESPIFDPEFGFGGNGIGGSTPVPPTAPGAPSNGSDLATCVGDGRFSKYMMNVGPGFQLDTPNPHCIKRNFQQQILDTAGRWDPNVLAVLRAPTYAAFHPSFDRDVSYANASIGVHGAGHRAVHGEMSNLWSSMNDPLFFLHHANIDRMWAIWQELKPENLWDIGGPIFANGTGVTTVEYPVEMAPYIGPTVPISAVVDTQNRNGQGILCYQYSDNGNPLP